MLNLGTEGKEYGVLKIQAHSLCRWQMVAKVRTEKAGWRVSVLLWVDGESEQVSMPYLAACISELSVFTMKVTMTTVEMGFEKDEKVRRKLRPFIRLRMGKALFSSRCISTQMYLI